MRIIVYDPRPFFSFKIPQLKITELHNKQQIYIKNTKDIIYDTKSADKLKTKHCNCLDCVLTKSDQSGPCLNCVLTLSEPSPECLNCVYVLYGPCLEPV